MYVCIKWQTLFRDSVFGHPSQLDVSMICLPSNYKSLGTTHFSGYGTAWTKRQISEYLPSRQKRGSRPLHATTK
jgi:hypothetical protein